LCPCTAFPPVNAKKTICEALGLSDLHLYSTLKYGTIAAGSNAEVSWKIAVPDFLVFKLVV